MTTNASTSGPSGISISVIIPVYDDLKGLTDTIDSLQNQTLPASQFEVIVVNDGGNDAITAYCSRQHLTCVNVVPNAGSYNARNKGLEAAQGYNFAFIDADAIADTNWLKNGLKHLAEYDYVAGDVKVPIEQVTDIATFHDHLTAFPVDHYFDEHGFGVTGNLFITKSVIERAGPFNPLLRSGGDFEFGARVGAKSGLKKFYAADCVVYHPPRTHVEKLAKMRRVKQGQQSLVKLDQDRFGWLNNSINFKLLLPPRQSSVNSIYRPHPQFSKWQLYLYVYRLRLHKFFDSFA